MYTTKTLHFYLLIVWYIISSKSVSKSVALVFGGVQKDWVSRHLFRHCISSSYNLWSFFICLFIQELANSIRCAHSDLFSNTWPSSDLIRMYCRQYKSKVWCQSPCSCITSFGVWSLNVTRINHCTWFSTTVREELFTCGVSFSSTKMVTCIVFALFTSRHVQVTCASENIKWEFGWVGHPAHWILRMWKWSHHANA